jgi:hypothetical protein
MQSFSEVLQTLPSCEGITALELRDASGKVQALIENKPGSVGSLRVYAYLAEKWGCIDANAAREGLELYAEHTADARANPGKHPNIDRLLALLNSDARYTMALLGRSSA